MLWIIVLPVVLAISVFIFVCKNSYDGFEDYIMNFLLAILTFMLSALLGLAIAACIHFAFGDNFPKKETVIEQELSTLKLDNGINGSFFLGSGSIDSNVYLTHIIEENGTFKIEKTNAEIATIIYTDDKPYKEIIKTNYKGFWANLITLNFTKDKVVFYIPEGSIKENYVIE